MKYKDLRDFIAQLEQNGQLRRISREIDPYLEMTEISDRTLRAGGPALLFENPKGYAMPVLTNLFGTPDRVAMGMGQPNVAALRQVGIWLSYLKEPEPPKGLKDAWNSLPVFRKVLDMAPKEISRPPCQECVLEGEAVDLARLPVQTCWPGDAGPLMVMLHGFGSDRASWFLNQSEAAAYARTLALDLPGPVRPPPPTRPHALVRPLPARSGPPGLRAGAC